MEVPPMGDTVTIDAAVLAELQRQAAEAPALVERARQALANPVPRAGSVPVVQRPLAVLSASVPAAVPSEADWSDFTFGMGLGGRPKPRPLMVVDLRSAGGVAPSAPPQTAPTAALDDFVAGLHLNGGRA
jgi:hypothetical protein